MFAKKSGNVHANDTTVLKKQIFSFIFVLSPVFLLVLGKLCVVIQAMCIDEEVATHICIQGHNIISQAAEIPQMM